MNSKEIVNSVIFALLIEHFIEQEISVKNVI
jgi:hypothetical protein